ncbi:MAG: acyltransferase family protein, partial [Desulfobacterales bacterium]|nr:acyltransferase family protein [Desulfobacterales bacterium]
LRIIGAISIVLFHYTFRGYAADDMSKLFFPVIGEIFKYGYLGIYIFFILSGYTIILSAQKKNFFDFVYARIFRLYPSFWIAVCVTTLATLFFQSSRYHVEPKQFLINLTMLSGYVGVKSVDGAYWFMFVILKFYFLISLLLLFKLIRFQKYIAGIWLFSSLILMSIDIPKIGFFLIPEYAPFLISGMIFYSAKREGWDTYKYFIMFTSFISSQYIVHSGILRFNQHYSTELSVYLVFIVILTIYLYMYASTITNKHIVLSKAVVTLSVSTYPLYLIHQNFGFMVFNNYGPYGNKYIVLLATFIFMVFLSVIIVKFIEPNLYKIMAQIIPYRKAQKSLH